MNKLRTFFSSLIKSSTQPTYGNDIIWAKGSFSFKYFVFFTFLTAAVTTGVFAVPLSAISLERIATELSWLYPSDLVVTVDPQTGLTINQPLPYTIYMPADGEEDAPTEFVPAVTFASESADLTFDKIASFGSALVITDQNIYARRDDSNRFEVTPLPDVEERFTFDQTVLNDWLGAFLGHPFIANKLYVPILVVILFGLIFFFMLLTRGVTALFYALIAWIIAFIVMNGKKVSYGKMVQLSVHTLTPVIILAYIFDFAGYTFFQGWVYFFAYLIWTLVMVSQLRPRVNVAPVVATPLPAAPVVRSPKTTKRASSKPTRKRKVASKR